MSSSGYNGGRIKSILDHLYTRDLMGCGAIKIWLCIEDDDDMNPVIPTYLM